MTSRVNLKLLNARSEIVASPAHRACTDQSFELPAGMYVAMGLMFAGFVAVLAFAFRSNMAVSYGVIFAFLVTYFGVPALFPRLARRYSNARSLDWAAFRERGITTATGHATSIEATILILLLPFLIFCFATAVATIAALV